jgi:hypothetical protein
MPDEAAEEPFGQRFRGVAEGEVKLADEDHLQTLIAAVERQPDPDPFWAALLPDLTNALTAVLDVYAATDQAEPASDPSAYQRPSIVPHAQNRNHERWTLLFDLIWRTFVDAQDGALSRHHVARWRTTPYLAFTRRPATCGRVSCCLAIGSSKVLSAIWVEVDDALELSEQLEL